MTINGSGTAIAGKGGVMLQKQPGLHVLRLKAVAGDLNVKQLKRIARVAKRYAKGEVHLSTRQGIEIPHIHRDNLEAALKELQEAGVAMGATGTRIRVIVACPGEQICKWGVFDTKRIAGQLDATYFNRETPSKFKMAVTGCANNCTKANENDIGIRGAIEPSWNLKNCSDCGVCVRKCPSASISRTGKGDGRFHYDVDRHTCINCSACVLVCSGKAWVVSRKGYNLSIGGTMGKAPRFATLLKKVIESEKELFLLIESAIAVYRKYAAPRERFGHMIDREGLEKITAEIVEVAESGNKRQKKKDAKNRKKTTVTVTECA
ncbi:MAG: sulfite reductase subunit beta [Chlorobiaceae bacterium]|nr:sulfite reductase subunit beta [Chlorobiaceae bacterium]